MKKLYVVLFLGFLVAASMASKPLRAYVTSKALVPSDQFDHRIMDIKAVDLLNKS